MAVAAMLLVFVYDHARKMFGGLYIFSVARGVALCEERGIGFVKW